MGRLSYSKVRALTRVATPELEGTLLGIAEHATGSQIDRIVAGYLRAGRTEGAPRRDYYVRWERDENGDLVICARLAPLDGEIFVKTLAAMADETDATGEDGSAEPCTGVPVNGFSRTDPSRTRPVGERRSHRGTADALVRMCERALRTDAGHADPNERFLTLVHVDAATLARERVNDDAICETDEGWPISPTLARLLTCDGATARAIVDGDGTVLDVGRKTRVVPARLARALRIRDRVCRFPSCTNAVYSWHHIKHWADGGPTDRANLVGLCKAHHRAVHDEHFIIATSGDETFRFHRPDATLIPDVPSARVVTGRIEDDQAHLVIDRATVGGAWRGERLDVHYAVSVLMQDPPRSRAG